MRRLYTHWQTGLGKRAVIYYLGMKTEYQKAREAFALRTIGGSYYLIPLHRIPEKLVQLDSTGAVFWQTVAEQRTEAEAAAVIAKKYDITKERAESDLKKFLTKVTADGMKTPNKSEEVAGLAPANLPYTGSIELTGRCNLFCFHCYAIGERSKTGLETAEVMEILDKVREAGCLFIQLTGGECTMHPGFAEIYTHCRKSGIIPTVSTNATLITDKLLKMFAKYPPRLIKISLYGAGAETHEAVTRVKGSYARTIKGAAALRERGLRVMFASTLFRNNLRERERMQRLAKRMGIPIHFYSQLIPTLTGKMDFSEQMLTKEEVNKIPPNEELEFYPLSPDKQVMGGKYFDCSAGSRSFHIDSEGKLYMCKVDRTAGYPLVNENFGAAWKKLGRHAKKRLTLPANCRTCKVKDVCRVCPPKLELAAKAGSPRLYCSV